MGRGDGPGGLRLARGPLPFDADGNLAGSVSDTANVAFRSPVLQGENIRTFGDFEYGMINLCASDFTPIALPTWGHIAQIASDLSIPPRVWPFTKADRKAAYKNFPPNPDQAQYCIFAARSPGDSNWYGFAPSGAFIWSGRCSSPL